MSDCQFSWWNAEHKMSCKCAKKEFHWSDSSDDGKHLCRCEWPGLWPGGNITVINKTAGS